MLAKEYGFSGNPLVDIQIANSQEFIILSGKLDNIRVTKENLMIDLKDQLEQKFQLKIKHLSVQEFNIKLTLATKFASKKRKKELRYSLKLLKKIQTLRAKEKNTLSLIHKLSKESTGMKSVFVTFQRIKHKQYFLKMMKKRLYRYRLYKHMNLKRDQRLIIGNRMLYALEPPEPINVIWENYSYSERNKLARRIISWIIYVILYLVRKKMKKKSPFYCFTEKMVFIIFSDFELLLLQEPVSKANDQYPSMSSLSSPPRAIGAILDQPEIESRKTELLLYRSSRPAH